jgi:hypothetical protein
MISFKSAAKNTAEHGTGATEEAQTLLSKTNEDYSIQNSPARFYIESQVNN